MDHKLFTRLRYVVNQTTENATESQGKSFTQIPTTILESFIPGYSIISRFILEVFGFDVGILVSLGLIVFATVHVSSYLWNRGYLIFEKFFTSSVYVDDGDDLFDSILDWIGEQQMAKISRSVKAVTRHAHGARDSSDGDKKEDGEAATDENGIFNFGKWAAKTPPRYEPYFGIHRFWHQGRLYYFDRSRREVQVTPWSGRSGEEETIQLTCIGRSTTPIRQLLSEIKLWALKKEKSLTNIRRPASKEFSRRYGAWDRVTARPSRPMDTISLDADQKRKIIADINEYLHPSSPQWYSTRGIPWRRGYLFHGPPGEFALCRILRRLADTRVQELVRVVCALPWLDYLDWTYTLYLFSNPR
jgi:mitochondrial chaperone BCS1